MNENTIVIRQNGFKQTVIHMGWSKTLFYFSFISILRAP